MLELFWILASCQARTVPPRATGCEKMFPSPILSQQSMCVSGGLPKQNATQATTMARSNKQTLKHSVDYLPALQMHGKAMNND